ncbi:MAG: CAP domain-containing protein, partial [Roseiflexaceae bacterium]
MRTRILLALIACLMAITLQPAQPTHAAQRCFSETNQCIDGRIREFWEQNGGLAIFGFPIGPEEQATVDGKTFTVQRFERNRLELHPENARPYDVLLGRLGADRLAQQGRDWFTFAKNGDTGGCKVFAETGHSVCGAILNAWRKSGLKLD